MYFVIKDPEEKKDLRGEEHRPSKKRKHRRRKLSNHILNLAYFYM